MAENIQFVPMPPSLREVLSTIRAVCDLPNGEVKSKLLAGMAEVLTYEANPLVYIPAEESNKNG